MRINLKYYMKTGAVPLATWLLFSFVLLATGCIKDDEPQDFVKAGDMVPEFEVTLSDGTQFKSREPDGRITYLILFNTDCPDCRRELPLLQKEYEDSEPETTRYVCISREEGREAVAAYWNENNLTMPWYADDTRYIFSMFASSGIPRVYTISPSGIIIRITL